MWACAIADLIESFTEAQTVVLGDVTYGACCVDDYTARALGCDMLVHYGHSCLSSSYTIIQSYNYLILLNDAVPIDTTSIRTLYVFVEISVDRKHLAETVRYNFPEAAQIKQSVPDIVAASSAASLDIASPSPAVDPVNSDKPYTIACVGTVQFLAAVQALGADLLQLETQSASQLAITAGLSSDIDTDARPTKRRAIAVHVPQVKPLSPGEILGCTAPHLPSDTDAILYVGDGRFHLESIMIANPSLPAYRYDPYTKKLTAEGYAHLEMRKMRESAVVDARKSLGKMREQSGDEAELWGVVLGTLGRQGSMTVLKVDSHSSFSDSSAHVCMSTVGHRSPASVLKHTDPTLRTITHQAVANGRTRQHLCADFLPSLIHRLGLRLSKTASDAVRSEYSAGSDGVDLVHRQES